VHFAIHYADMALGTALAARLVFPVLGAVILDAVTAIKPLIVNFYFGLPELAMVETLKAAGAVILASVIAVRAAVVLQNRSADTVIAQGFEAGRYRGMSQGYVDSGTAGNFALVLQMVDAGSLEVTAGGGAAGGHGIAPVYFGGWNAGQARRPSPGGQFGNVTLSQENQFK